MDRLIILILRILGGERLERNKAQEKKSSGVFVLTPFYLGIAVLLFSQFNGNGKAALAIWLAVTVLLTVFWFAQNLWSRFVPLTVSYIVGVLAWVAVFWIAAHIDLAKF